MARLPHWIAFILVAAILGACGSDASPQRSGARSVSGGISVQDGFETYLQRYSGGWFVLVRHADDRRAAARALRRFRSDLFKSRIFAPLDGQFGANADGSDIRYTPPYASVVVMTTDEPILAVDTESVLEAFPEVIAPTIARLRTRLREAGIRRAEIGWPADEPPLPPLP